jgi:hypothetical protein
MTKGQEMKLRYWWLRFKYQILPRIFGQIHYYGIFGTGKIYRNRRGYVEVGVIVGESGLYAGAPPHELRIEYIFPLNDWEDMKGVVTIMNENRDLPAYLAKASIHCYDITLVKDELREANRTLAEMEDAMQKDIIAANEEDACG